MVLKRKLPTQESKVEKKEAEVIEDNFDMAIETDNKPVKEAEEGHDLNDAFPDQVEDRPEDFIPEELRVLETSSGIVTEDTAVETKITPAAEVIDNEELKQEQENQEIAPVSFDEPEESFEMSIDSQPMPSEQEFSMNETPANPFEDNSAAPAELPGDDILFEEPKIENDSFGSLPEEPSVNFDNQEHANWQEVVESKHEDHKDDNFDSFETVAWENEAETKPEATLENKKEETIEDNFMEDTFGSSDNGGIIPEIPGLDLDSTKPAEFMGANSKELTLNGDAKRKLVGGVALIALVFGGVFAYSNMDTTTDIANRLAGSITEASQDIAETKEQEDQLIDDGIDITKTEDVIDFSEVSKEDEDSLENEFSALDDEDSEEDAATEINLLEPTLDPETTASGKEVITATGEEEMPDDVEEGVNLIANITEELEKQEAEKKGIKVKKEENELKDEGNAADINKKVDDQLAEYRKLLAEEQDPGKKVKPGAFFDGSFAGDEAEDTAEVAPQTSVNVSKVKLSKEGTAVPTDYIATASEIEGHQIVEYPKGVARKQDEGIRQLDHFRSLIVEKEDKRVRMPKGVKPGLRNQGFPKFKVISIVPNYGLIGEYSNKKGILMIGDGFKGWELVGVYESYAEFKKDTRKHIISLK